MSERKHQVFGDWRDLREAVEAADQTWSARGNDEREALWAFAEGVIREFQPLRERCLTCGEIIPSREAYRCADCHTPHCRGCIRRHFASDQPATKHPS